MDSYKIVDRFVNIHSLNSQDIISEQTHLILKISKFSKTEMLKILFSKINFKKSKCNFKILSLMFGDNEFLYL